MSASLRRSAAILAAALSVSCVTGTYQRVNLFEPRPDELVRPLTESPSDLQDCLDALGAPNFVWPTDGATAMAWAHSHQRGWGVRVSASIRGVSASVNYASALAKAQALALFFDEEWNLLYLRRGKLADLLEEHPQRVQPVPPRPDGSERGEGEPGTSGEPDASVAGEESEDSSPPE